MSSSISASSTLGLGLEKMNFQKSFGWVRFNLNVKGKRSNVTSIAVIKGDIHLSVWR